MIDDNTWTDNWNETELVEVLDKKHIRIILTQISSS